MASGSRGSDERSCASELVRQAGEDRYVRVELPFGWLVDVWAQGLAIIWGRFCLAARSTGDDRTWRLTTVGPDLARPSVVTLQLGS